MTRILMAGVAVADFIFKVAEMPDRAEKYRALDAFVTSGGNAANSAVAGARMGAEVLLAARLGDDPVGDIILSKLNAHGVDTRLVHRFAAGRSSFSSIYIDAEGERQIMNFRGSGLGEDASWLEFDGHFDAVLADNRWPPITLRAIAMAQSAARPSIIDAEAPFDPASVKGATHVAFSAQGFADFAGPGEISPLLPSAARQLGTWVAVTDGANGTWHVDGDEVVHTPAFKVDVVDTLGAGDTWHATLALYLAEGASEADAVRQANAAGALKCTRTGGVDGAPTRREIEQFIKEAERCN
ncbi:MAG: PfkB family carbohydrate kinase [Rhizobiaceae bacterium]